MLRPLFISFILLLYTVHGKVSAQGITVKVTLDDMPMSRAPVFVNGTLHESADSKGILRLSENRIKPGDTVSSEVPGLEKASTIFTNNADTLFLKLTTDILISDVVVSTRHTAKKYFRKKVRNRRTSFDYAEFIYNFRLGISEGTTVSSMFTYADLPDYYRRYFDESQQGVRMKDLPPGMLHNIDSVLMYCHLAAVMAVPSHTDLKNDFMVEMKDLGTVDGKRVFSIFSSPEDASNPLSSSLSAKLHVDSNTHDVRSSEVTVLQNGYATVKAECKYAYDAPLDILYPLEINATFTSHLQENEVYTIWMENSRIKRYPRTMPSSLKRSTFQISKGEKQYNSMLKRWFSSH